MILQAAQPQHPPLRCIRPPLARPQSPACVLDTSKLLVAHISLFRRPSGPGINPCNATDYFWLSDKPNPNDATGGIVGGPDKDDKFIDSRNEWTYTEVRSGWQAWVSSVFVQMAWIVFAANTSGCTPRQASAQRSLYVVSLPFVCIKMITFVCCRVYGVHCAEASIAMRTVPLTCAAAVCDK